MSKSASCLIASGVFIAAILAFGTGPSAAMSQSSALSRAVVDDGALLVAQQSSKGKGKSKQAKSKISPEHQEKIRQHVPQEYHQYIPGMSSGGSGR